MKQEGLTVVESGRLVELEQTIARGQKTFVEVGAALAEIRDTRLYKQEHGTFEEYCRVEWGWEKAYANHVIRAADVVKSLPENLATMVATERQARELVKVAPGERAGLVQAIADSGEPVTAAAIKRHLPPAPGLVRDGTGWPIPTQLVPLWLRADEAQEMLTAISHIRGALRTAQEGQDVLFAEVLFSSVLSHLNQAFTDIKTAKPYAVCPACQGQVPDKCLLCRGRGLISEFKWDHAVSREDKAFRQRQHQQVAGSQLLKTA